MYVKLNRKRNRKIIYTKFISLVPTQCARNNGGCSHLCLLSSVSAKNHTCRCPNGMMLREDGKSCVHSDESNSTTPRKTSPSPTIRIVSTGKPSQTSPSGTTRKSTTSNKGKECLCDGNKKSYLKERIK